VALREFAEGRSCLRAIDQRGRSGTSGVNRSSRSVFLQVDQDVCGTYFGIFCRVSLDRRVRWHLCRISNVRLKLLHPHRDHGP
jgi:hypothetical protein